MQSFEELINGANVASLLKESGKYRAHTPNETLSDHMNLVTHYFKQLVALHGLETLIDSQLLKLSNHSKKLASFAKQIFWQAILYHDFGKVNENFQRKLGNTVHFPKAISNGIDSQHSILSGFIFLVHEIVDAIANLHGESSKSQQKIICFIFALAQNIVRHHSPRLDDLSDDRTFERLTPELFNRLKHYLNCYNKPIGDQLLHGLSSLRKQNVRFEKLDFEWFTLTRLNFSLLTAADYYATSHYCSNWGNHYDAFGILTDADRARHFLNLKSTQLHNTELYKNQKAILSQSRHQIKKKSNANLNRLRSRMAAEVIEAVRVNSHRKLFYLEAPTGAGKTNMAFIATQELLQANPELGKVFYVFPFTTLVEQTRMAAIETLGLRPDEWIELHTRAPWKHKEASEAVNDGLYGNERLDDIHNQFVNYPYAFLSHIRLFDILKANDKSSIYLMHRLANSVVVIDEVQAYNPDLWDKMAYLLKEYAEALNIRVVIMSATLPKIGALADAEFCHLLPNAIDRFFTNVNFSERVNFSEELLHRKRPKKEEKKEYLEWLATEVFQRSENYRVEHGNVRTIVEFIFKKSATEFAALAIDRFHGYEIYVLSGTILEPRRNEIIHKLKKEANTSTNILLVTTQVIEAGVDIDMDLGFKNRSIIDSDEQLAGRVNRNVNKQGCAVYLFDLDDPSVIYGKDRRYKEIRKGLEQEYFNILRTKRFDRMYDKVKAWLDRTNKENGMAGTGSDYRNRIIGQLNFPGVDQELTLLDQDNTSVFVPLNLPLKGGHGFVFTSQQLQFLADFEIYPFEEKLSGESVFTLYRRLVTNPTSIFTDRKRNLKILQSIMAKYTFSLFADSRLVKELVSGGNQEEFGYLYLASHREVYDYELGLLDDKFREMIFI